MSAKRFRIALSFAGEKRDFVAQVAAILASRFDEDRILYDKFHEAEFARPRLGRYLPRLYREQTDLVVVVICQDYSQKEWPGLEWDAVFDLLKKHQEADVMLCRFNGATVEGLFTDAGYVELDDKSPEQTAKLILKRLELNETKSRDPISRAIEVEPEGQPTLASLPVANLALTDAKLKPRDGTTKVEPFRGQMGYFSLFGLPPKRFPFYPPGYMLPIEIECYLSAYQGYPHTTLVIKVSGVMPYEITAACCLYVIERLEEIVGEILAEIKADKGRAMTLLGQVIEPQRIALFHATLSYKGYSAVMDAASKKGVSIWERHGPLIHAKDADSDYISFGRGDESR